MGITLCFAPVLLLVVSLGYGMLSPMNRPVGVGFACVALIFAIFNAYLYRVRPWLYHFRRGSMDGYRFVSGLPLFGTVFVVVAGLKGFGDPRAAVIGLIALTVDTAGLPWFLMMTWGDTSLWDA
jgi:hypothetical protein